MDTAQLDLFADATVDDARRAREMWAARFERVDHRLPDGLVVQGYVCPDPGCRASVPNGFVLHLNHGWDPGVPGVEPIDGRCRSLRARARRASVEAS